MENNFIKLESYKKEFGARLRKAIDDSSYNQTQVCKMTGINDSTLSNYVSGFKIPNAYKIKQLCETLSVSPNYLILGETDNKLKYKELEDFLFKHVIRDKENEDYSEAEKELINILRQEQETAEIKQKLIQDIVELVKNNPQIIDRIIYGIDIYQKYGGELDLHLIDYDEMFEKFGVRDIVELNEILLKKLKQKTTGTAPGGNHANVPQTSKHENESGTS